MRYLSICSGIEAASVAWAPLEWEPVAFVEIEPFPCAVLAHHYPGVPNLGDMRQVQWSRYRGRVDVVVGGTPCQAFSVAGLRQSLKDERGNLTLEYVRAVHAIRPRYAVWENVPGVLSTSDNAFGCFLGALIGADEALEVAEGWPSAGMVSGPAGSAAWRILDAQYFGLAQRRQRVFLVFCPGDGADPGEILFERPRSLGHPPARSEAGQGVTHSLAQCLGASGRGVSRGARVEGKTPLSPSLSKATTPGGAIDVATACRAKGGTGHGDFESETFVAHALRAEGFDASEDGTGRGTPLIPCVAPCLTGNYGKQPDNSNTSAGPLLVPVNHVREVGLYRCADCECEYPALGSTDPSSPRVQLDGFMLMANKCPSCGGDCDGTVTYPPGSFGADAEGCGVVDGVVGAFNNTGQGWWTESDAAGTVRDASGGGASHSTVIAQAIPIQQVSATLGAGDGARGWRNDLDQGAFIPCAIPILEVGKRTGASTDDPRAGIGIGNEGDPMYTLQAGEQHGVLAFQENQRSEVRLTETVGALSAGGGKPGQGYPAVLAFSSKDHGADAEDDLSPTLRAGGHTESHANAGFRWPSPSICADAKAARCQRWPACGRQVAVAAGHTWGGQKAPSRRVLQTPGLSRRLPGHHVSRQAGGGWAEVQGARKFDGRARHGLDRPPNHGGRQ